MYPAPKKLIETKKRLVVDTDLNNNDREEDVEITTETIDLTGPTTVDMEREDSWDFKP